MLLTLLLLGPTLEGSQTLQDADGNTNIEIGATTADEIDIDIAGTINIFATFDQN